ncbi:MAG TPA: PRC-barrel domain-containing protein [Dehalococcoidia bacterium]|nr:PRC-barrel domain-containing protein [Dehalococcoidia bacterium]
MHIDTQPLEARTLRGREVIAIREGMVVGRVRNLVFDPIEHRLLGLLVSRTRRAAALFLPASAIRRLGPHAVTTDHQANLDPLSAHPRAAALVASGVRFEGTPVMLDDGARIATLRDIWIDTSFNVVRYDAAHGVFPFEQRLQIFPGQVIIVGPDAMVLQADPRAGVPAPAG